MEPLIKSDEYLKRVNKLVNSFPLALLIGSMLVVFLYHSFDLLIKQDQESLLGITMLSDSFFQGTVVTVVVYFLKSRIIGAVVQTKATDFTKGEVQGYLPVVIGTNLFKQKVGYLIVQNNELSLYVKKVDGYVLETKWTDLTKIEFSVIHETYNLFMLFVYNFRESIQISDGTKTIKVLFPVPKSSVSEMTAFIQDYIK